MSEDRQGPLSVLMRVIQNLYQDKVTDSQAQGSVWSRSETEAMAQPATGAYLMLRGNMWERS